MRLIEKTCYSRVVYLVTRGPEFKKAVRELAIISGPDFSSEGFNGYIECEFIVTIDQLDVFTKIWNEWYSLSSEERAEYYKLASGK